MCCEPFCHLLGDDRASVPDWQPCRVTLQTLFLCCLEDSDLLRVQSPHRALGAGGRRGWLPACRQPARS